MTRDASRAGVEPAAVRNDFQDFIEISTGLRLSLYGYNLFEDPPSTFAPVENIPVTADYVIGPGDELLIRAWGQIDVDYRAVVDRNGLINIPRVGPVAVTGVRYQDIANHVRTAVSRNFRNFELLVTMGQLRSIQVFVVGNAQRPGAYTLSSMSTLVNAVFAVGGPSGRGTMRAIQLKRGGRLVTEFDLYDLLLAGDKSRDVALLPGDVVYFPPIGPLAAISGSVNNPGIFELKGQATAGSLLQFAGGLTTTAQTRRASIERIENRSTRVVDQFALDDTGLKRAVKDGDLVSVYSISPKIENAVTLRGHVALPLRLPFAAGMRVRDLIPEKDALIRPDYFLRRNLAGRVDPATQGRLIDQQGRLIDQQGRLIDTQGRLVDTQGRLIDPQGRSFDPQARPFDPQARSFDPQARSFDPQARSFDPQGRLTDPQGGLNDSQQTGARESVTQRRLMADVRKLSDEINWDYAVVERQNKADLSAVLIPFNLGKAVLEGDPLHDIVLMPGDVVTVFSKMDVVAPAKRRSVVVSLEGEFDHAGVYQAAPGETLRQLVIRAGGVTPQAYLFGAELTRESTRKSQEERLQQAIIEHERELQRAAASRARNVASAEDAASLKTEADAQQSLAARLKTLRPTGRIVLELPENPTVANLPDIALEDGDRLLLPQRPAMVSVFGTVFNEAAFLYRPEKTLSDYLAQAGGPRKEADTRSIYLLRADGSVVSNRGGFLAGSLPSARVMPGDAIVVPEDLTRTTLTKDLKDWTQIFYQFGLGAAALQVIGNR